MRVCDFHKQRACAHACESLHLVLNIPSVILHLTSLWRGRGYQINHSKVFTNVQSQMQTEWHMVTLFKCFSMCLWCQHLFHTPLHLKEGKKMFP